jgi:hypothetical protein
MDEGRRMSWARLAFWEKSRFENTHYQFTFTETDSHAKADPKEHFLLNLLDSGSTFTNESVHNCMNFIQHWTSLGQLPSQPLMTRLLELCFMCDKFVTQLSCLSDVLPNDNWIFRSLAKMTFQKTDIFKRSISDNSAIWSFLCEKLLINANSISIDYHKSYHERDEGCCFLIESIVFYWRLNRPLAGKLIGVEDLAFDFCEFCAGVDNEIGIG